MLMRAPDPTPQPPTVQPLSPATPTLQRRIYEGHDHGGRYEINDETCALNYHQSWFFNFQTNQTPAERLRYMEAARQQIESVWSNKFPLVPEGESCPCHPDGITVQVIMHPHERDRGEARGFSIIVTPTEARGFTNQPLRRIDLGTAHDTPLSMGDGLTQQRVAHEFGHTIGLTDEYHGWAGLFNTAGSRDRPSIMHSGDEVRPRHYQPFADLVNLQIGAGCTYSPGGHRLAEFENPVTRWSSLPFTFLPERSDFIIGLTMDRRIGNEALLGLIYSTVGLMSMWDEAAQQVTTGPTVGLRLNQIAHPLYVNVRTGILFDPADPTSTEHLRLPISLDLGVRGEGFQVGVNYTPIVDLLDEGRWTHLVGVGFEMDWPWERRRDR